MDTFGMGAKRPNGQRTADPRVFQYRYGSRPSAPNADAPNDEPSSYGSGGPIVPNPTDLQRSPSSGVPPLSPKPDPKPTPKPDPKPEPPKDPGKDKPKPKPPRSGRRRSSK